MPSLLEAAVALIDSSPPAAGQVLIGYDTSNYFGVSVAADGEVTFDAVGSGAGFVYRDTLTVNPPSADAIAAVIGEDGYNGTLFLSATGSGKDARIVAGNSRSIVFETAASTTPVATGTTILTLNPSSVVFNSMPVSGITTLTFTGKVESSTASSFGSALSATGLRTYADATYGMVLAGYGTTSDWLLSNRSGQLVISNPSGTNDVTVHEDLTVGGVAAIGGSTSAYQLQVTTTGNNGVRVSNGTNEIYTGTTAGAAVVGTLTAHDFSLIRNGLVGMTVGASGVGLGTSSPAVDIHIHDTGAGASILMSGGGSLGETYGGYLHGYGVSGQGGYLVMGIRSAGTYLPAITVDHNANVAIGDLSGSNTLTIQSGSGVGNYGQIYFTDGTGNQGQITYEQNNEIFRFYAAGTEYFRINYNSGSPVVETRGGAAFTSAGALTVGASVVLSTAQYIYWGGAVDPTGGYIGQSASSGFLIRPSDASNYVNVQGALQTIGDVTTQKAGDVTYTLYDTTTGVGGSARTLSVLAFKGASTTDVERTFSQINFDSTDATNGAEDARIVFKNMVNGSLTDALLLNGTSTTAYGAFSVDPSSGNASLTLDRPNTSQSSVIDFTRAGTQEWQFYTQTGGTAFLNLYNFGVGEVALQFDPTDSQAQFNGPVYLSDPRLGLGSESLGRYPVYLGGSVTSDGSGTEMSYLRLSPTITGVSGDTSFLTHAFIAAGTINTQATDTVGIVATMYLGEPNITVGAGGTVTTGASLYVAGAPTEATNNYSIYVTSGITRFNGDFHQHSSQYMTANSPIYLTASTSYGYIQGDGSGYVYLGTSGSWKMRLAATQVATSEVTHDYTKTTGSLSHQIRRTGTNSNDEYVYYEAVGNSGEASARYTQLGVVKLSGNTNPVAYLVLQAEDGAANLFWVDNSDKLRTSQTGSHLGTTSGTVVGDQTSSYKVKKDFRVLGPKDDRAALDLVVSTTMEEYRFHDDPRRGNKLMRGYVIRGREWFGMDLDNETPTFDREQVIGAHGMSIRALYAENLELRERIEKLEAQLN